MKTITKSDIEKMNYVQLLANINEINRPPGGKDSIRRIVQNSFLTKSSNVLDVGCNTGYSSFEITHLIGCHVTGIDISPEMIEVAKLFASKDTHSEKLEFLVADGMRLPFESESFDLTMSGGSTAFIEDKVRALQEYARVTRTWGFVADINFFYKEKPPTELIEKMNRLMNINIQPWQREYWLDLYHNTGLELYYTHFADVCVPSRKEVNIYCEQMSTTVNADSDARLLIKNRLIEIMTLFAENHGYLAYGIFVLRKRDTPEQISLFDA